MQGSKIVATKKTSIKIVFNKLPQIAAQLPAEVAMVVQKAAYDVEANAKASMSGPKTGFIYKRGNKMHQASAPGEAPAIDTGTLVNSIQSRMTGMSSAEVSVGAAYGLPLEYGTEDGHIAPRPFMTPAAEKVKPGFIEACKQLLLRLR